MRNILIISIFKNIEFKLIKALCIVELRVVAKKADFYQYVLYLNEMINVLNNHPKNRLEIITISEMMDYVYLKISFV